MFELHSQQRLKPSALSFKNPLSPKAHGSPNYQDLEPEIFQLISKWYHYAILSLGDVKPNSSDPKWIAEQLDISDYEAKDAFERLLKLKLIQRRQKGFTQVSRPLWMPTYASTNAVRLSHQQNLRKAEESLIRDDVKLELFSTLTVAVNERYLADAREAIAQFRETLRGLVERGSTGRVYTLAVQMFPISKGVQRP